MVVLGVMLHSGWVVLMTWGLRRPLRGLNWGRIDGLLVKGGRGHDGVVDDRDGRRRRGMVRLHWSRGRHSLEANLVGGHGDGAGWCGQEL
jgi:hypothetical protein